MANIYQLNAALESFIEACESGEIPEEAINDTLESLEGEIDMKLDDIACACKNIEALIEDIKAEECKLEERRKRKEKQLERLKEYMKSAMLASGRSSLETARNKITFRTSRAIKVCDVPEFIKWAKDYAPQLVSVTTTEKPSLTEIKAAWGRYDMPGVTVEERKNIQIK